ncbi:MAG: phospholipid carrier-dependent glycosyltransferase [Acidobacteriota bacterium]|nr:phospholipid carrier-dependent glycosyltransferase [Acidobacteriota bacterium]
MAVAPRVKFRVAVLVLATCGVALVFDHTRLDSPTMDEPFHTLAGAEYAISGTYYANLEHPPLVKLLSGLALRAAGGRAPKMDVPFSMGSAEQPRPFSFHSPLAPEKLFGVARAPVAALFFLLVVVAASAVRAWAGDLAGILTAAVLAFEPNLLAHAGVVHTDLAAALGFFATLVLATRAFERRSLWLWTATGAALGASLAAKFSCVLLVPMVAILALVGLFRERREAARAGRPPDLLPLRGLLLAGVASAAVLLGSYAVAMRHMSGPEAEKAVRIFLVSRQAPRETIDRILAISRLSKEAGHYAAGLAGIAVQNRTGGGVNYLHGRLSVDGFWEYFFVAFAVKSSLGFLAILVVACGVGVARRVRPDLVLLTLVLPPAYLFLTGMATSYNIGIRHMLPVYPLLLAAAVLVLFRALPARSAAAVLLAGAVVQLGETLRTHPHELSFFNEAAGGPANGAAWLNDSNLDWGQDLGRLARRLRERGDEERATIAYFGGGDVPYYAPRATVFAPAVTPVRPGLWAVSSFLMCCGPEATAFHGDPAGAAGFGRLRQTVSARGTPVDRVGYSIVLYDVKEQNP